MTKSPRVSLVVSTFNKPASLAKVLAGLQLQVRQPDETLFADDGSDNSTRQLIEGFTAGSRSPVKHVWHEHNGFRKTRSLLPTMLGSLSEGFGLRAAAALSGRKMFRSLSRVARPSGYGY